MSLNFQPMFVLGSLGIAGVLAVARIVLGWAMGSS
jgi:hypothetical protein